MAVPDLGQRQIGEAQVFKLNHGFLTQEVIHPQNLVLAQHLVQAPVQLAGRVDVVPERLLDRDPSGSHGATAKSAWSAFPVLAPSSLPWPRSSRRICKAIFPFDSRGAYGELGGFRDEYPGGVIHLFRYLVGHFSAMHQHKGPPGPLPPEREAMWRDAMNNPDYKIYPHVYNLIAQKGQHMPPYYNVLVDPYDNEAAVTEERGRVRRHQGADLYRLRLVRLHLQDPSQRRQHWFRNIKAPKKLLLAGPAHLERPYHTFHNEVLRWHDHWLKGIDTGIMDEPPVRFWVMGANEWRTASDWPLPETQWTKLYLSSWERLTPDPPAPSSVDRDAAAGLLSCRCRRRRPPRSSACAT